MTTDIDSNAVVSCPFVLHAISYLERNDFTDISQIGLRLLCAKDGKREVFVWVTVKAPHLLSHVSEIALPAKLIETATLVGARIDAIVVQQSNPNGTILMKHLMNVMET